MILHGKDLIVSIDGNANMASKSCTLNVSAKSMVKTSPTSGDWEEVLSGKKSWSLTTNHLVKAATGGVPENWNYITAFAVSNTLENGWHARGEQEAGVGDSYIFDEAGLVNGIDVLRVNSKTCQLLENRHFNGDATGLNDYLNGNTIGNDDLLLIMTNGEFVLPADVVSTLSETYHTALPFIEMGVVSQWGSTYDNTPLIIACGKGITQGYAKLNSISNDLNFTLVDGTNFVINGIPGAIEMVGKTVSVRMTDEHGSIWSGQAIVKQFKVTGTKGNLMAGSFAFAGNGELQSNKKIDMPQFFTPGVYVNRIIIDMSKSNSAEMITGDIGDAAGIFNYRMSFTHRYLCKYLGNGNMAICRLNDKDSNFFHDGTPATLDGTQGDVYVKMGGIPYELKQIEEKRYMFSIADQIMTDNWKVWAENNLIAAFRAQPTTGYKNAEAGVAGGLYYLRSIASQQPVFADTFAKLDEAMAMMNPNYFGKVGPEEHAIIALLYYMKYGNPNSQAICGPGGSGQATGASTIMGMQDTDATTGTAFVNLFGLEDWWRGGEGEYMERIRYANGKIYVTPWGGSEAAGVDISTPLANEETVIRNMLFSNNPLFIIPAGSQSPQSKDWGTYFCDGVRIPGHSKIVTRGKGDDAFSGGLTAMKLGRNTTAEDTDATRLCYHGNVEEYTDPEDFLALDAVAPVS